MLIVVGGQCRKIGKSSVVAGLIRALPSARWTAIKISPHFHTPAPGGGYVLTEERAPGDTDSGRYLAAGAERSFWLQVDEGRLHEALPAIQALVYRSANTIIESNAIVDYLTPDLFLLVVDGSPAGWKASGLRQLDRADALILIQAGAAAPEATRPPGNRPAFLIRPPGYSCDGLVRLVSDRLSANDK
ncbi:MAG: hypothetical protein KIT09_20125 [Bryobacteraceae bacterium]|nr:hypothetical protein [Bryobacteraceae bacterium]